MAADGGATLWLFGTIHDAGMSSVPQVARAALEGSTRVVTELGAEPAEPELFRRHARIARGPGIDQQLAASDWYDLRDALRGVIKEDDLRRAAPWYAMTLLSTHSAPSPGPSMDLLIAKRARERGIGVEALETWDDQLALLARVVTLADLTEAIRARHTMKCDLARMVRAYEAGDTETMTALLVIPRTAETMLAPRNHAWLPELERHLAGDGAFVAVGLGHLLGDSGLPALLVARGYRVERVTAR